MKAAQKNFGRDALVSAAWLNEHLGAPDLCVLDASWHLPWVKRDARAEFQAGHIPGARFFDIDAISDRTTPLPHMLPPPEEFARAVEALGVGSDKRVVVYDATGLLSAPRAWWMLRVFGHNAVRVLEGGLPAWREAGLPVQSGDGEPVEAGVRFSPRFRPELVRDIGAMRKNLSSARFQVVDARSKPRFAGSEAELRPGVRPGHIPGSRNLPYGDILSADGRYMLEPARIMERFAAAGIDPGAKLVTSCGSGISACILALGLYTAGHDEIAVYDGSWTEWGGTPDTPLETGPATAKRYAMKKDTLVTDAGRHPELNSGIVNPPVYRASTVVFSTMAALENAAKNPYDGVYYGRFGTPTTFAFEDAIAALEGGYRAVALSSGLAAIAASLLAVLKAGDHLLMVDSVYGPTRKLCNQLLGNLGIETTYYAPELGAAIADLIRANTRAVFVEAPGSLTFEMQDIPAIATAAHAKGALVLMDNTWATPLYFRALDHGIDIVIHSATKYIVGHADAMLGVATAREETLWRRIKDAAIWIGNCPGSEELYLGLRGLRTLAVRLARHQETALLLAVWLKHRKEVRRILHPGLPGAPGHAIWKRDFSGASGLFTVILDDRPRAARAAFLDGMRHFKMGFSWGGFESLILPIDPSPLRTATPWREEGFAVRLHAGLENPDDLIADLEAGLKRYAV